MRFFADCVAIAEIAARPLLVAFVFAAALTAANAVLEKYLGGKE